MSRVQAKATALEWEAMGDDETYYALRDGPRQYEASWVLYTMSRFLPVEQMELMRDLAAKQKMIEAPTGRAAYAERVQGGRGVAERDARMRMHGDAIRMLAAYDQAALRRVGRDGCLCFRGIVWGDTQAQLSRRVGYPQASIRSLRKLVQLTCEAMQIYHDENALDAARHNAVTM